MPFSATVNLGTVGVAITSVKLYGCTGNSGTDCTGCTALTGYENVSVSTFPLLVSGIPTGVRYIQAEALGACSADAVKQCISISGIPEPTATPVPTMTPTPSATTNSTTPTPTPTPSATIDGATPNPTSTMTPTPSATTGTGNCVINGTTSVSPGTPNQYGQIILQTTGRVMNLSVFGGASTGNSSTLTLTVVGSSLTPTPNPNSVTITANAYQTVTGTLTLPDTGTYNYTLSISAVGSSGNNGSFTCGDSYVAPTPIPTQTLGLTNCVRLTKGVATTGTENCNLDRVQRHEVTLYDANGANIQTAPYDITVTLTGTDAGQPSTWTLTIPTGQSSVYEDIVTREFTGVCGERDGQISRFVSGISEVSPTNIGVCTPAPTPSAGVTLNPIYYGQGLSTNTDHCGTNYSISASFFSSADTISELFNQTIYTTDTGTQEFNGLSLWYPVSLTSGGSTENGGYYAIKINSNGFVEDLVSIASDCSVDVF